VVAATGVAVDDASVPTCADLDGDSWPDVVVAEAEGSVAVLRNLGGG
jgi:hypothetical protein